MTDKFSGANKLHLICIKIQISFTMNYAEQNIMINQSINHATLEKEAAIFKALGHPLRLAMVHALANGPLCVCDLHKLANAVAPKDLSTISRHLGTLQQAGIISSERRGTNIYYRLTLSCLTSFLQCTGSVLQRSDGLSCQDKNILR